MFFGLGLFIFIVFVILICVLFKIPKTKYKKITMCIFLMIIISLFILLFSLFIYGMTLGSLGDPYAHGRYTYDTSKLFLVGLTLSFIFGFLGFISLFLTNKKNTVHDYS